MKGQKTMKKKPMWKAAGFAARLGFVTFGFLAVWMVSGLVVPVDAAWPWYLYCVLAGGCALVCLACLNIASEADDKVEAMEIWP